MPGESDYRAGSMLIEEAPRYHEDQRGRAFVGHAGKFLNVLIRSVGLNRENVYITNMVKCSSQITVTLYQAKYKPVRSISTDKWKASGPK
jgi:uracil-DNA glycosylase family 4